MNQELDATAVPHRPIQAGERIASMDILRGFALLGIFMMNIEFFNRSMLANNGGIWPGAQGLDHYVALFVHVFVTGKFWLLFSMLFGMGFVVLKVRTDNAGRGFNGFYLRRIAALAFFGLAHAVFFWTGDILLTYALAALPLMLFGNLKPKSAFILGVVVYALFALVIMLSGLAMSQLDAETLAKTAPELKDMWRQAAAADAVFAQGGFWEITRQRLMDFSQQAAILPFFVPAALGVFLVGGAILRLGWLHNLAVQRGKYVRILLICLPIAVLFIGLALRVGYQFGPDANHGKSMLSMGLMMLGNFPLALSYLALLLLALGSARLHSVLSVFAPAGRMALTNYLSQSLICSIVFFGYGFGLYGQWGRAGQITFVLVAFFLQLLFSHWWMARYRYGPMEWLWRWMSYGQRPEMRRT